MHFFLKLSTILYFIFCVLQFIHILKSAYQDGQGSSNTAMFYVLLCDTALCGSEILKVDLVCCDISSWSPMEMAVVNSVFHST